jgi:hypothetical protein
MTRMITETFLFTRKYVLFCNELEKYLYFVLMIMSINTQEKSKLNKLALFCF